MRESNTMQHSPSTIVNTVMSNSSNLNGSSNVNAASNVQHHPHSNQPQANQSSQDLGHEYLLEY